MKINHPATAGSFESSDIMIAVEDNPNKTIEIDLESPVMRQFGEQIKGTILSTVKKAGLTSALIHVIDQGALNYTIVARTTTAINRACDCKDRNPWEEGC